MSTGGNHRPSEILLELKQFNVHYGPVQAVKGVSLTVGEGELVTIIGANGAGKSSTLNAISGVAPHGGEVWFRGIRIDGFTPPKIAALGIIQVPEGAKVFPLFTVMDNLRMGAYLQKDKRIVQGQMERVFELFPVLKERVGQRADTLSGGERSMLAIGRALMARPSLLLMDEPSLGLSPLFCQRLEKQLATINQEGIAVILVEQNARMGLRLSNRGYVFEKGKVVLEGLSKDLIGMDEIKKSYLGI